VGTAIWEVPGPKSGIASYIVGGWELGTIVTATSGSPFTVTVGGGGDPLNTGYNGDFSMDYANLVPGCNPTPGVTRNALALPIAFNPACFTVPAAPSQSFYNANCDPKLGAFPVCGNLVGNSGRNNFYGPGLTTVDFSAFKNFQFTEQFKLQFRAEFFNVLNHTNFQAPHFIATQNNSIGLSNAGVIDATTTSSRQIQLGLKLVW
jgi:hypothetical protein